MRRRALTAVLLFSLAAAATLRFANFSARATELPEKLWRQPRAMSASDWIWGPGGRDRAPVPPFRFLHIDTVGSSPKVLVRDRNNRAWSVKFGGEVIPECFAPRFLMAVGYTGEDAYYVAGGRIEGIGKLPAAIRHAFSRPGEFSGVRFELRDQPDLVFTYRNWAWNDNPFLGSRELAGLKIVMMLLSNWDAKDARDGRESNNGIFRAARGGGPALLYSVFDWGASLGKWGGFRRRSKSDCVGFAADTPHFLEAVRAGRVQFGFSGQHAGDLRGDITVEDVRWLCTYLRRITPEDLRLGLAASGATPRQTECWAASLQSRIGQLQAVAESSAVAQPQAADPAGFPPRDSATR